MGLHTKAGNPHERMAAGLCLVAGGLDRGDGDRVDDVVHRGATGEIVDRLAQALEDRPDAYDMTPSRRSGWVINPPSKLSVVIL